MTLTNMQIYNYANNLADAFSDPNTKFSVKVNFYLIKNKNLLTELAKDIEQNRIDIIQKAGSLNEETNQYDVPDEKMEEVIKELNELFDCTQEVTIYKVKIEDLGEKMMLSTKQMDALMFMIED